jgi:replicative DNA helicase
MTADLASVTPSEEELSDERAVLGAMIIDRQARWDVLPLLLPDDFKRPAHRVIFETLARMEDTGEEIDVHLLRAELEKGPATWGGPVYLIDLMQACVTTAHAAQYAGLVRDRAARRDLYQAAGQISALARNPELDVDDRAERAAKLLDEATGRDMSTSAELLGDLMPDFLTRLEIGDTGPKVRTGWDELDRLIPGLRPGQLVTIGARPGMGKTAAMVGLAACTAIKEGKPVLFWSLEMSRDEILERLLSAVAGVPLARIIDRQLNEDDWQRIGRVYPRIAAAPLRISDDVGMRLHDLRATLRTMKREGSPAELVVVDYLQLMTSADRTENRQTEVSAYARGLKLAAKEYGVPIVVGSQLNRNAESRSDKRPSLADLRESGAVEQDSDVVILLYRDDAYDRESPEAGTIEMIVAKHRNGPTGVAHLAFRHAYAQIANAYLMTIDHADGM